jgi:hypothetical protein
MLVFVHVKAAHAHRPVVVKNKGSKENPVLVEKPEISWAFYGKLQGQPHYFRIFSPVPFNLYINILVPDYNPEGDLVPMHDMSFDLLKEDALLFSAHGLESSWRRFYEEYGKDHYYWGPEFDKDVEPGTYYIRVFNSSNSGKYSLAIGKIEKFNFFTIIGAMIKAKSLDRWFFKE